MLGMLLRRMRKSKNQKGFTLVELIVVIAILGILSAVAIGRFGGFTDSAKKSRVVAEHSMLVSAIQMWQSENGSEKFPDDLGALDKYVDGGKTSLSKAKEDNKEAHILGGTNAADGTLTSRYDKEEELIYPKPVTP